jgi:hypothetical protein
VEHARQPRTGGRLPLDLWIYDTNDRRTVAFTDYGLDFLRKLIADYKRYPPPRCPERMLTLGREQRHENAAACRLRGSNGDVVSSFEDHASP